MNDKSSWAVPGDRVTLNRKLTEAMAHPRGIRTKDTIDTVCTIEQRVLTGQII